MCSPPVSQSHGCIAKRVQLSCPFGIASLCGRGTLNPPLSLLRSVEPLNSFETASLLYPLNPREPLNISYVLSISFLPSSNLTVVKHHGGNQVYRLEHNEQLKPCLHGHLLPLSLNHGLACTSPFQLIIILISGTAPKPDRAAAWDGARW